MLEDIITLSEEGQEEPDQNKNINNDREAGLALRQAAMEGRQKQPRQGDGGQGGSGDGGKILVTK